MPNPPPWRQAPKPAAMDPGPARLEASVQRAREALLDGDPDRSELERTARRRATGMQLENEIRTAAERVGAGAAVFRDAVLLCAQVLEAGGEPDRAGRLLLDAGESERAALVAERCGNLELLQAALGAAAEPARQAQQAAIAFAGYETALGRGHLTEAADALKRAMAARPDNPAYRELHDQLMNRCPQPPALVLDSSEGVLTLALAPATVGRAPDCGVPLRMPGMPRKAAVVELEEDHARLRGGNGEVLWTAPMLPHGPGPAAPVPLGGVTVEVHTSGAAVVVQVPGLAAQAWVVAPERLAWFHGCAVRLRWPVGGFPRLVAEGVPLRVNGGEVLPGGGDLAVDALVDIGDQHFTVIR